MQRTQSHELLRVVSITIHLPTMILEDSMAAETSMGNPYALSRYMDQDTLCPI